MNYKETLFFIGKCLTLGHEEIHLDFVSNQIQKNTIDWDEVVKLSTTHYVFPALYLNLKKVNLIQFLPEDLVEYMQHITQLNRERNEQIIKQAKELNHYLLENNIKPIFLKGTGNLLEGLYEDIAERMVGDIDFLVEEKDYEKAQKILLEFGYEKVHKTAYDYPMFKHFPRLNKVGEIAAIEIHKQILKEEYASEFNYESIKIDVQKINGISFLSFEDQLALSIFAKQLNDDGIHFKNIALRNSYDAYLLSKKVNTINVITKFEKLSDSLNNYLAITSEVFGKPDSLQYQKNESSKQYISDFYKYLENSELNKKFTKKKSRELFIKKRLAILKKAIFNKEHRDWVLKRISDRDWQQEKLIQLGLKKPKSSS